MTNKIKAGSLVCMKNRKVGGQGLVLERVKDINEYTEFDLSTAWLQLYDKSREDYHFRDVGTYSSLWALRDDAKCSIKQAIYEDHASLNKQLISEFFSWNAAYRFLKEGKKVLDPNIDFCLVKWWKSPSDYSTEPAKYYKDKTIWTCSGFLKNL